MTGLPHTPPLASVVQFSQKPEDFQIQPDKRYHQAERAVPFAVFRDEVSRTLFNEFKINNQIQRRNCDHHKAERDTDVARFKYQRYSAAKK